MTTTTMIETVDGVVIPGEETDATIMGLDNADVEDNVAQQLSEMVDHEAFQGDVKIMSDTHVGSGATIGFTMDLNYDGPLRVCPNVIGVDIGCGLLATQFSGDLPELSAVDDIIRDVVPMGRSVHSRAAYHMGEDFPWDDCMGKWEQTKARFGLDNPDWFEGYSLEDYFKPLCRRVEYDPMRAINSMGTLGGGNHFIELTTDENDDQWFVLHSGSRGIGLTIAQYWQDRATELRTNDWIQSELPEELQHYVVPDMDDPELAQWFQGGKGQSYINSDAIKADVSNNYLIGYLHDQIREAHPNNRDVNDDLDYLEGQEAAGYLVDMIFAQTYAWENRRRMMALILDELDLVEQKHVHSPHNLVDFDDMVVRKGATRAHEGEQFVLPFNMAEGTYICEGLGNEDWNRSAPHGAGRVMSRTRAFNELDMDEFEDQMEDIYSTSVTEDTLDEAPQAYKSASLIQDAIEPTADIVHKLDPVLNIKALE